MLNVWGPNELLCNNNDAYGCKDQLFKVIEDLTTVALSACTCLTTRDW